MSDVQPTQCPKCHSRKREYGVLDSGRFSYGSVRFRSAKSGFFTLDFALNKLNSPQPFGNFSTRFAGTWNLFDSFASWRGINQAKQMNEAAGHMLDRTDQEIVFWVVSSYYDVLLAGKELEVAEQSAKTAQSIMDRSQTRFDSGLTVESDLLTAKVRMAARKQEVIRAKNALEVARAQLNTAMGMPLDSPFQLTGELAERTLSIPAVQDAEKLALTFSNTC